MSCEQAGSLTLATVGVFTPQKLANATNQSSFSLAPRQLLSIFCCLIAKLCPTLCDPMDCRPPQTPLSVGFLGEEY